jgi:hypothetical protein
VVVRIATGRAPHFPHAVTEAQQLLDGAWSDLIGQLPDPFTVEGIAEPFIGVCPGTNLSNTLEAGGFPLEGDTTITVRITDFARAGFNPFPGMRVVKFGRKYIVDQVNRNALYWLLTLEDAQEQGARA